MKEKNQSSFSDHIPKLLKALFFITFILYISHNAIKRHIQAKTLKHSHNFSVLIVLAQIIDKTPNKIYMKQKQQEITTKKHEEKHFVNINCVITQLKVKE